MAENHDPKDAPQPDDQDGKWFLGFLYFNPKDKRLLPPKRLPGLGWTVNFGNPYSILLFVILIAALIFLENMIKK